jgi:hypothetical protein
MPPAAWPPWYHAWCRFQSAVPNYCLYKFVIHVGMAALLDMQQRAVNQR